MIAVTGSAGLIGGRLIHRLWESGHKNLLAVDHMQALNTRRAFEWGRTQKIATMNVEDFLIQHSTLKLSALFHMGAISSTTETNRELLQRNNIDYSMRLWNCATEQGFPYYYASSASTYGAGELGYSDDPSLTPKLKTLNLYGWSKLSFDQKVLEHHQNQKPQPPHWAGFRFFNVYGPWEDHKQKQSSVVWQAYLQFLESGYVKLFKSHRDDIADGEQKRDFVHVDDVVKVMLYFFKCTNTTKPPQNSGIYNVGTGQARTFLDLALSTAKSMKAPLATAQKQSQLIRFIDMPESLRDHYQYWTQADLTRLRAAGYSEAFLSLEQGIQNYINEIKNQNSNH